MSTVLVTGDSGFVGSHCILQRLVTGHQVRTTVRSLTREADVRAMLKAGGAEPRNRLTFAVADLEQDAGWPEAVAGCEYVLHIASPFPMGIPKHEDDLIVPAREGALRVLRASRDAGVTRVVLTSSFAAIGYGHEDQVVPFDEKSWTDANGDDVRPYVKSKTLAERAAWDFIAREGGALELSVVNPVAVFGPVPGPDDSTSILVVQRLMDGDMEELGLLGSAKHVDAHQGDRVRAMVNFDINGDGDTVLFGPPAGGDDARLRRALVETCAEEALDCVRFARMPPGDDRSFGKAGFPTLSIATLPAAEAHQLWLLQHAGAASGLAQGTLPAIINTIHTPDDVVAKVDGAAMARTYRLAAALVRRLSTAAARE